MTFRDMNLRVFAGKEIPRVFFQPRIGAWYAWHKMSGKLPERYHGMTLLELFDDLNASVRYAHPYTGAPGPVVQVFSPKSRARQNLEKERGIRIHETPYGELVEVLWRTPNTKWTVKRADDLRKVRWVYQHMTYCFSVENFEKGSQTIGERGEPQFWVPKSPYQVLVAQIWMDFEDLIYALVDYPGEVEETMKVIDESYDRLYEEITSYGKVKIVSFGENLHDQLFSPKYFERYHIPFYEKRSNQLRHAGIYTHIHLDGYFHSILGYLKYLPFDGLEALTPFPQGDVSLEEIKENIGDKVLLDGIPAVLFLPTYSQEELMKTMEKIVRLFHPRLVLGVSDEPPEGAGEEAIERIRMISEWCRES